MCFFGFLQHSEDVDGNLRCCTVFGAHKKLFGNVFELEEGEFPGRYSFCLLVEVDKNSKSLYSAAQQNAGAKYMLVLN